MNYLPFSTRAAHHLAACTGRWEQEEELAYGIEVFTLTTVNTALTLALGWLVGVFAETLVCLAAVALLRAFAGGAHSSSRWRCAVVTILAFPGMGLLASSLVHLGRGVTDVVALVVMVSGLIGMACLAPVDSSSAPIISPQRRRRLKALALVAMGLMAIVVLVLRVAGYETIQLALVLGTLWSLILLSPLGGHGWRVVDSFFSKGGEDT